MWRDVSEERITCNFRVSKIGLARNQVRHLLHTGFSLGRFSTLKMGLIRSSETSIHIRTTRHYILEDGNIHPSSIFMNQHSSNLNMAHISFRNAGILSKETTRCHKPFADLAAQADSWLDSDMPWTLVVMTAALLRRTLSCQLHLAHRTDHPPLANHTLGTAISLCC
jgi:hypothetical protein